MWVVVSPKNDTGGLATLAKSPIELVGVSSRHRHAPFEKETRLANSWPEPARADSPAPHPGVRHAGPRPLIGVSSPQWSPVPMKTAIEHRAEPADAGRLVYGRLGRDARIEFALVRCFPLNCNQSAQIGACGQSARRLGRPCHVLSCPSRRATLNS